MQLQTSGACSQPAVAGMMGAQFLANVDNSRPLGRCEDNQTAEERTWYSPWPRRCCTCRFSASRCSSASRSRCSFSRSGSPRKPSRSRSCVPRCPAAACWARSSCATEFRLQVFGRTHDTLPISAYFSNAHPGSHGMGAPLRTTPHDEHRKLPAHICSRAAPPACNPLLPSA